jgi:Cupin
LDSLSDVLSLLKLRSYVSGGFDASGDWAVQVGPHDGIKFHAVILGECWILVDDTPEPVRSERVNISCRQKGNPFVSLATWP